MDNDVDYELDYNGLFPAKWRHTMIIFHLIFDMNKVIASNHDFKPQMT